MFNRNDQSDDRQSDDRDSTPRNYNPEQQRRYAAGMSDQERRYYGPNRSWPGNPRPDQYYGQGYGRGYQGDYYEQVTQGDYGRGEYGRGQYDRERFSGNYGQHGNAPGYAPSQGYGASDYGQQYGDLTQQGLMGPHVGKGPRSYQRSDDTIRDEINQRLTQHGHIDASDVDVTVKDGIVTLTGNVEDRRSKRLAEDIADDVYGVKDVHNQLHVQENFFQQMAEKLRGHEAMQRASQSSQQQNETTGANSH